MDLTSSYSHLWICRHYWKAWTTFQVTYTNHSDLDNAAHYLQHLHRVSNTSDVQILAICLLTNSLC